MADLLGPPADGGKPGSGDGARLVELLRRPVKNSQVLLGTPGPRTFHRHIDIPPVPVTDTRTVGPHAPGAGR
jgi:hypothetical protein